MAEIDVLRLAATGARISRIAEALGCSEDQAIEALLRAVRKAASQALDQDGAREVELAHLDLLRQALTPAALRGDIAAARLLIRLHASRALLLGLIAAEPAQIEDEEVSELDRIRARRAERRELPASR
jgi:hypothetical protein